jgi:fumarate hydratase subunit beta
MARALAGKLLNAAAPVAERIDGMESWIELETPLRKRDVVSLEAGQLVRLSGVLYTARDAAHARLVGMLRAGEPLPFDPQGQVIYYVGPSPAPPGLPIGSAGPTTSYRMDRYTPELLKAGIRATIGKGARGNDVIEAMRKYKAVYMAATGGAAALLASRILSSEVIAFEDLGAEAVHRLEVEGFPTVVVNDVNGNDLYEMGLRRWRRG